MMQTYKYSRNSWENQEKAIFDGVGMYDIPVIEPEEHPHYDKWDASLYFFKFNYGK